MYIVPMVVALIQFVALLFFRKKIPKTISAEFSLDSYEGSKESSMTVDMTIQQAREQTVCIKEQDTWGNLVKPEEYRKVIA